MQHRRCEAYRQAAGAEVVKRAPSANDLIPSQRVAQKTASQTKQYQLKVVGTSCDVYCHGAQQGEHSFEGPDGRLASRLEPTGKITRSL